MRFSSGLAIVLGVCALGACSDSEAAASGGACSRDIDCAEGRICDQGRCVVPSGGTGGTGGTGAAGADSGGAATGGAPPDSGADTSANDGGKACTADSECPTGTLCIALVCRAPGACTSSTDRTGVEAEYDVTDDAGMRRLRVRDIARE